MTQTMEIVYCWRNCKSRRWISWGRFKLSAMENLTIIRQEVMFLVQLTTLLESLGRIARRKSTTEGYFCLLMAWANPPSIKMSSKHWPSKSKAMISKSTLSPLISWNLMIQKVTRSISNNCFLSQFNTEMLNYFWNSKISALTTCRSCQPPSQSNFTKSSGREIQTLWPNLKGLCRLLQGCKSRSQHTKL